MSAPRLTVARFTGSVAAAIIMGGFVTAFVAGFDLLFFNSHNYDFYSSIWFFWCFGYIVRAAIQILLEARAI